MKRILTIIAILASCFAISEAHAQRVIKGTDGKVYIDVTDMLAEAWSSTSVAGQYDETSNLNKPFKRFEVEKVHRYGGDWATAMTDCPAGWRLPNQKELMLIYIMRDLLTDAGVSDRFSNFWSSTLRKSDGTQAWMVDLFSGLVMNAPKTNLCSVRCVREVR